MKSPYFCILIFDGEMTGKTYNKIILLVIVLTMSFSSDSFAQIYSKPHASGRLPKDYPNKVTPNFDKKSLLTACILAWTQRPSHHRCGVIFHRLWVSLSGSSLTIEKYVALSMEVCRGEKPTVKFWHTKFCLKVNLIIMGWPSFHWAIPFSKTNLGDYALLSAIPFRKLASMDWMLKLAVHLCRSSAQSFEFQLITKCMAIFSPYRGQVIRIILNSMSRRGCTARI